MRVSDLPKPSTVPNSSRRRFLRGLLGSGAALGLLGGATVAQSYLHGVTRHTRTLPGLQAPLRLAFLTDLHYGLFMHENNVQQWIEATNAERPDVVLLGGDLMDYRTDGPPTPLLRQLERLQAPLGVYGVWGNHDYGSFGYYGNRHYGSKRPDWQNRREELRVAFAGAGVTLLRNEGRTLRADLHIGGVDDLWHGQPDAAAALAGAGSRATLLVTHNPDLLPDLLAPVGLVLCGHTHGGQVRLPLLGALMVPSRYGQKYAMGWVAGAHETPAYVSRGLGVSGLPVRNLCTPEITMLTLNPA
ncbi:metallophosphoesterase [Deinococcus sp. QL22]|uniref:metallophosphoesterase n=1 Tax=Deinococcus sp. QL22 TaxID=2939437 RepID=UPI0020174E79|nr:metallophosphoesterase [Deinococcus sp. QL22]UQN05130.1 metallophosphoesterase [Deinococcus sp. QL22]